MHPVPFVAFLSAVAAAGAMSACSASSGSPGHAYAMGERVEVGRLVYTVFETRWLTQIGEGPAARVPQNRFFLVRMSVSNTGDGELLIPNLAVEDDKGNSYPELSDGEGVPQFLGVLRPVTKASAAVGNAVFDAPPQHYRLRLWDEENQRTALVDIPLTFRSDIPEVPASLNAPESAPR
jgi:hypothetical protein